MLVSSVKRFSWLVGCVSWDTSILIRLLFLLIAKGNVIAIFDPLNPPLVENLDPSEANPRGRIHCLGYPQTAMPAQLEGGLQPRSKSLQQLCAKPQYGGGLPGQHAGGYCAFLPGQTPDFYRATIAFDDGHDVQTNRQLAQSRFRVQCSLRCFCTSVTNGAEKEHPVFIDGLTQCIIIKPSLVQEFNADYREEFEQNVAGQHVRNLLLSEVAFNQGVRQHLQSGASLNGHIVFEDVLDHYDIGFEHDITAQDPDSAVDCTGNLPTFAMPPPINIADFQGAGSVMNPNQRLCATFYDGGYP